MIIIDIQADVRPLHGFPLMDCDEQMANFLKDESWEQNKSLLLAFYPNEHRFVNLSVKTAFISLLFYIMH